MVRIEQYVYPIQSLYLLCRCSEIYTVLSVRGFRRFILGLQPTAARQFCISRIVNADNIESRKRRYWLDSVSKAESSTLTIHGLPFGNQAVCTKFFAFAIGKSLNFLYQPKHRPKEMLAVLEPTIFRARVKETAIVLFMKELSRYYQLSPDKEFVFLPFPRRSVVHDIYMDQVEPGLECHQQYFLYVWRTNSLCTHIKLRRHLLFALCDTCVQFRDLQVVHHTHEQRMMLKSAQLSHHAFVVRERQLYYHRRSMGASPLYDAMSMIVDAADQAKYALPYHHIRTHSSQKALRAPVHLMGVLVHGEAVHAFTYYENFKQGTNVTIDAIHSALCVKLQKDGVLPSVLYLQLDNTSKQCKNRFMLGWLGYLVLLGRFTTIVLSFLPVGHTHEDIDQVFSRLSVYLACHDAHNMDELHDAIKKSYQTRDGHRAQCSFWDRTANFSEWIEEYLEIFDGISTFRQFRLFKVDGEVRVQARKNTSIATEEWAGIRGSDSMTPVFRGDGPPLQMIDVPPTQRRELMCDDELQKMKKSIQELAEARRMNVDKLTGVLTGVDSLADPTDLPFAWDLTACLNWKVDEHVRIDVVEEEARTVYLYDIDDILLFQSHAQSICQFWLGQIVSLGVGDHDGEYEVWWMQAFQDRQWGTYRLGYEERSSNTRKSKVSQIPLVGWQWESSVQDRVLMINDGKNLSAASKTLIVNYVERWSQDKEGMGEHIDALEPAPEDARIELYID